MKNNLNITFERKFINLIKKIIHFNFVTKFIGRIIFQPFYKTLRLGNDKKRFKATLWVDRKKEAFDFWALKKNSELYIEALFFLKSFKIERKKIIHDLKTLDPSIKVPGGGNEALLYFLVKMIGAKKVLETGVAAGSSSRSILEGINEIGGVELFSNDLAMLLDEDKVGIFVTKKFRKKWFLTREGDKKNLPEIFKKEKNFDLIYYDSDKSYSAKRWFHSEILKNPLPKILIYDDIDRCSFFSECVNHFNYNYRVFGNAGIIFFNKKFY